MRFCSTWPPDWVAKSTPFAMDGGSGMIMLPEIQRGSATMDPPRCTTSKAMTLPSVTVPLVTGKVGANFDGGPSTGTYRKRRPSGDR